MKRRDFILGAFFLIGFTKSALADLPKMIVFKSPTCGCCTAWIEHIEKAGFHVESKNLNQQQLFKLKSQSGISLELSSCHTAFINNYFIEGHVPAEDIKALLLQKPDALGITVPNMPLGSPGMEIDDRKDPYDTLLVKRNGSSEIFRSHREITN
tara:strand:+ start:497 stop:958 length:462 start_codon:yes stop_codon:yes gene_type:complete